MFAIIEEFCAFALKTLSNILPTLDPCGRHLANENQAMATGWVQKSNRRDQADMMILVETKVVDLAHRI